MKNFEITVRATDESELESLTFAAENHDDILAIARLAQAKGYFERDEVAQLVIGFKLFSEVVLRHRNEPEFEEIRAAIQEFVPKLKAMNRSREVDEL